MRLTHYPDLGLIDSAKNSEIAFIHSYKNQQFQYDTTLNLPHLFKKLSEKKKIGTEFEVLFKEKRTEDSIFVRRKRKERKHTLTYI